MDAGRITSRSLLTQIQGAILRIEALEARLAVIAGSTGTTVPLPLRARTALVPSRGKYNLRSHRLQPFARQIIDWLEAGKSQKEILGLLGGLGIQTSDTALSRFIRGRCIPDEAFDGA